MKKKVVSLLAAMTLAVSALAGCGAAADSTADMAAAENTQTAAAEDTAATQEAADTTAATAGLKAGFIFLHDENSTYDLNFMNAAKEACEKLGVECVTKTNIPEGQECYEAACELADAGCDFIFADSFGHEDYVIEAAKEYPDIQFSHATGTKAHTENLDNYHNAFASIYDGRYLAGIAAGMKINEMIAMVILQKTRLRWVMLVLILTQKLFPVIHLSSWVRVLYALPLLWKLPLQVPGMMRQQKRKALIN